MSIGSEPCAVLEARIRMVDGQWNLARVDFPGGNLWFRDHGLPVGRKVRVRVLARDVSLAVRRPEGVSIQNVLSGHIEAVGDDTHPGLCIVRVRVGESALLARLTKRVVAELALTKDREVWVQVKSVALME